MSIVNPSLWPGLAVVLALAAGGCAGGPFAQVAEAEECREGLTEAGSPLKVCQSGGDVTVYSHRTDLEASDASFYDAVARELDFETIPVAAAPALKVADHQVSGCSLGPLDALEKAGIRYTDEANPAGQFSMLCTLAVTLTLEQ